IQIDPSGQMLVEEQPGLLRPDATVIKPLGEDDDVSGEAVAADVRHLPDPALVGLVDEDVVERPPVPRAARVVLAVRADEEQRMLEGITELVIEVEKLLVTGDLEASADAALEVEDDEPLPAAALAAADEEQLRRPERADLRAEVRLDLVGQTTAGERVAVPDAAVLDENPVVDPACGSRERLAALRGHLRAERSNPRCHLLPRSRWCRSPARS